MLLRRWGIVAPAGSSAILCLNSASMMTYGGRTQRAGMVMLLPGALPACFGLLLWGLPGWGMKFMETTPYGKCSPNLEIAPGPVADNVRMQELSAWPVQDGAGFELISEHTMDEACRPKEWIEGRLREATGVVRL